MDGSCNGSMEFSSISLLTPSLRPRICKLRYLLLLRVSTSLRWTLSFVLFVLCSLLPLNSCATLVALSEVLQDCLSFCFSLCHHRLVHSFIVRLLSFKLIDFLTICHDALYDCSSCFSSRHSLRLLPFYTFLQDWLYSTTHSAKSLVACYLLS